MGNPTPVFLVIFASLLAACQQLTSQTGQCDGTSSGSRYPSKTHRDPKNDITNIGSRKIGAGRLGNWYSLESEIRMGREYSQFVDKYVKLLDDAAVSEYINRIGQNLVHHSDASVPFTIEVIDFDEVNAFSVPGGYLYVNAGLILAADNEVELAAAMAYEIAHVAARHATRQMTRSNLATLLSIPLIFVGGGAGLALQGTTRAATPLAFTKFSRSFEAEADYLGLEYLYETGYDPEPL
jgi:beta-barrel assembly-enhancing protease